MIDHTPQPENTRRSSGPAPLSPGPLYDKVRPHAFSRDTSRAEDDSTSTGPAVREGVTGLTGRRFVNAALAGAMAYITFQTGAPLLGFIAVGLGAAWGGLVVRDLIREFGSR